MASKYPNSGPVTQSDEELRIVLGGRTGAGKSATGNTILGYSCFKSELSATSCTDICSKGRGTVDRQRVAVIDTPGLFDTRCNQTKTCMDLSQCIALSSPGPHVFLIVVRLDKFTCEEKKMVKNIQTIFGPTADKYSMVLFTRGDDLEGTTIDKFTKGNSDMQDLMARCNWQYHVFNNKKKDPRQVSELLHKIRNIVKMNGGSHYTNEMFEKAERELEENKQLILWTKNEEICKEKEKLEVQLRAEYEENLRIRRSGMERREREKEKQEKIFVEFNLILNTGLNPDQQREREHEVRQQERWESSERIRLERERWEMEKRMITEKHEWEVSQQKRALEEKYEREARAKAEAKTPRLFRWLLKKLIFLFGK